MSGGGVCRGYGSRAVLGYGGGYGAGYGREMHALAGGSKTVCGSPAEGGFCSWQCWPPLAMPTTRYSHILWSKAMNSKIHVGQVISIQDDMNEFESGEYKIKKLFQNFKDVDNINIAELEEAETRYDDHATWILLESVGNYSCIQCNPLSLNIQAYPVTR